MKANNFKEYRFIVIGDLGVPYDIIKQLTKYFSKLGFKIIHLNDYDNLKPEGKSQCLLATYIYGDCPHISPRQYTNDPCLLLEFTNMEGVSVLRAIGREENPKKCLKEIFEQINALHYVFTPNANQEERSSRNFTWSKDDIINFLQKNSTKNIEGEIIDVLKRKYNEEIATYLKENFNPNVEHSVLNLDTLINKYNLDKHIRIFRLIKDPNSLTCTVDSVFVDSVCQDLFWNDFIPYKLSDFMPEEERENLLDSIKLRQLKIDFQNNLYEVKNKENKRTLAFIENHVNGGKIPLDPVNIIRILYQLAPVYGLSDSRSLLEVICKTQEAREEIMDYLKHLADNPKERETIRALQADIEAAKNYVEFLEEHYDINWAKSERVDATTFLVTLKVKDRKEQHKVLFKYRQGKHPFDVKLELELLPQSND